MFAEPSVMSEYVLPYLLLMAEKYSESSAMAQRLSTWAEENAAPLLDNLTLCKSLRPGSTLVCLDTNCVGQVSCKMDCFNICINHLKVICYITVLY